MNKQIDTNKMITKLEKLNKKMKIWKEALEYCANHARPSIVQDVAKEALETK